MREAWRLITNDSTARLAFVLVLVLMATWAGLAYVVWKSDRKVRGIPKAREHDWP